MYCLNVGLGCIVFSLSGCCFGGIVFYCLDDVCAVSLLFIVWVSGRYRFYCMDAVWAASLVYCMCVVVAASFDY